MKSYRLQALLILLLLTYASLGEEEGGWMFCYNCKNLYHAPSAQGDANHCHGSETGHAHFKDVTPYILFVGKHPTPGSIWLKCTKCSMLFKDQSTGWCAHFRDKNGEINKHHVAEVGKEYTMFVRQPPWEPAQDGWTYCTKCGVCYFEQAENTSRCSYDEDKKLGPMHPHIPIDPKRINKALADNYNYAIGIGKVYIPKPAVTAKVQAKKVKIIAKAKARAGGPGNDLETVVPIARLEINLPDAGSDFLNTISAYLFGLGADALNTKLAGIFRTHPSVGSVDGLTFELTSVQVVVE